MLICQGFYSKATPARRVGRTFRNYCSAGRRVAVKLKDCVAGWSAVDNPAFGVHVNVVGTLLRLEANVTSRRINGGSSASCWFRKLYRGVSMCSWRPGSKSQPVVFPPHRRIPSTRPLDTACGQSQREAIDHLLRLGAGETIVDEYREAPYSSTMVSSAPHLKRRSIVNVGRSYPRAVCKE